MLQFRQEACRLYIARYSKRSPTMRLNFVWPASRSSCITTQWHDCYYVIMSGSSHCKHTGSYVVMLLVWTRFNGLLAFHPGSVACLFSISYLPRPGLASWQRKRAHASRKEITWLEWSQGIYPFLVYQPSPQGNPPHDNSARGGTNLKLSFAYKRTSSSKYTLLYKFQFSSVLFRLQ